jgi:uncharacterized protein (DUF2345 family)
VIEGEEDQRIVSISAEQGEVLETQEDQRVVNLKGQLQTQERLQVAGVSLHHVQISTALVQTLAPHGIDLSTSKQALAENQTHFRAWVGLLSLSLTQI